MKLKVIYIFASLIAFTLISCTSLNTDSPNRLIKYRIGESPKSFLTKLLEEEPTKNDFDEIIKPLSFKNEQLKYYKGIIINYKITRTDKSGGITTQTTNYEGDNFYVIFKNDKLQYMGYIYEFLNSSDSYLNDLGGELRILEEKGIN